MDPIEQNILFADRYRLIKRIGRGGFAEVWLADDTLADLQVAVKIYEGMDDDGLKIFVKEINKVYHLNHTNLLKPQHVAAWKGMPYLVMTYCSAGSLEKKIGQVTEQELWKIIHDVASGLAYLHSNNIIHQDIKPANILQDDMGNYVIIDFGISTLARDTLLKSTQRGYTNAGTLAYMGPERFNKDSAPIFANDIWSLGAMLYELLEGKTPFPADFGGGMQKAGAELPDITASVSKELKSAIYQMLSLNTWERPTAATLVELATNPKVINNQPTEEKSNAWVWWGIASIITATLIWIILILPKTYEMIGYTPEEAIIISLRMKGKKELSQVLQHVYKGDIFAKASIKGGIICDGDLFVLQIDKVGSEYISHNVEGAEYVNGASYVPPDNIWNPIYSSTYKSTIEHSYVPHPNSTKVVISFYINVSKNDTVKLKSYTFDINKRSIVRERTNVDNYANGHKCIDLGISVRWATCNIGAKDELSHGDYYAWGEIQTKEEYSWLTYKYCQGNTTTIFKYANGIDDKTKLDLSDDVANFQWGGKWRIPTYEEQRELATQCKWTYSERNGIKGYVITSKENENSIFLPVTGCMTDTHCSGEDLYGYYWSSSLYSNNNSQAWILNFSANGPKFYNSNRNLGRCIRPVCP